MKSDQPPVLKNKHGSFSIGDKVSFDVENQISGGYSWDSHGELRMRNGELIIKTRQGVVTIGKGYDAYIGSIRPQVASPYERPL